jgi:phage repressor protein C with HTH and peptisase S24 domain
MSKVHELIRAKVAEKGLDLANLSRRIGKSHSYLQQFLDPKRLSPKKLPEDVREALAPRLGVNPDDLRESVKAEIYPDTNVDLQSARVVPKVSSGGTSDRINVLGMAECGPDGWALWNGDVIDTIPRPPNLLGAPRAYAVYAMGESMEPRYYNGELLFIHPGKPISIGDFVLVQIRPALEGETPRALVKKLVKRSGSKVVLEQFNPPKKFDIKADDIVSIHRITGTES